jgi:hypothetical protein
MVESSEGQSSKRKLVKRLSWIIGTIVILGIIVLVVNVSAPTNGPGNISPAPPSPESIEQRFDGKDPKGKYGPDSRCADPPPSQPITSTQPPLMGPDGHVVGTVELRTSGICPVIWARVNWPNGSYDLPAGWSLHIRMHRPMPLPQKISEYISHNTTVYVYGNMLTTVRGCVYAEVYFSNAGGQTAATKTECVKST